MSFFNDSVKKALIFFFAYFPARCARQVRTLDNNVKLLYRIRVVFLFWVCDFLIRFAWRRWNIPACFLDSDMFRPFLWRTDGRRVLTFSGIALDLCWRFHILVTNELYLSSLTT